MQLTWAGHVTETKMKHKIIPAVHDLKRLVLAIKLTGRDGEKKSPSAERSTLKTN